MGRVFIARAYNTQQPKHMIFVIPIDQLRSTKNNICSSSRPPDHPQEISQEISRKKPNQDSEEAIRAMVT
jgi:hypothetical protein